MDHVSVNVQLASIGINGKIIGIPAVLTDVVAVDLAAVSGDQNPALRPTAKSVVKNACVAASFRIQENLNEHALQGVSVLDHLDFVNKFVVMDLNPELVLGLDVNRRRAVDV